MSLTKFLSEESGIFTDIVDLQDSEPLLKSVVTLIGDTSIQFYRVGVSDLGGLLLANGRWANPINSSKGKAPISGVATLTKNSDSFITANSTLTFPDVTGFTGGESVKVVGAKAATLSTLTVDGGNSELIEPANGSPTDTTSNLTTPGVSYEFIFNALTGNWEI